MNEFYVPDAKYTCCGCLTVNENLLTMSAKEISLYKSYVQEDSLKIVMKMCYICRHMLLKLERFISQCRKTSKFMKTVFEQDYQSKYKPNCGLVSTVSETHYIGPDMEFEIPIYYDDTHKQNNIAINCGLEKHECIDDIEKHEYIDDISNDFDKQENMDKYYEVIKNDDDIPLVMLKDSIKKDQVKKIRKKNVRNGVNCKQNTIKTETKEKKQLKEGFSSRMVQETNEYEVIKLTKEQVLKEMEETVRGEKYLRSVYKCERCAKGFNFKDIIETHMKKHSPEHGAFKCDICTQHCPSAVSLRGHMKSHTTRYKCKVCGNVRMSRQHLLEHYNVEHTFDASSYTCDHCPFKTFKRTVIQRHVKTHKVAKSLNCSICGAAFNNMHSLRMHVSRHDPSQQFRCPQCSLKFIYPSMLQRHMRSHSHRDHYCVECDVTFKSLDNLNLHYKRAKRHRDPATFKHKCPHCEERFLSAPSVLAHLTAAHGAAKSCACQLCGKLYSSRDSLKSHERRKHARGNFSCDTCRREFSRKHTLAKHLQTHAVDGQGCGKLSQLDRLEKQEESIPTNKHEP